jgi:hypothetical protein
MTYMDRCCLQSSPPKGSLVAGAIGLSQQDIHDGIFWAKEGKCRAEQDVDIESMTSRSWYILVVYENISDQDRMPKEQKSHAHRNRDGSDQEVGWKLGIIRCGSVPVSDSRGRQGDQGYQLCP